MILAFIAALLVGGCLGLLGSGGSILTVPALVYLLGQDDKVAIAGSLFIVGCIAFSGAAQYAFKGRVHLRSILLFGLPGMMGSWFGAHLSKLVSGTVQLTLFAVVMLAASVSMLRHRPQGSSRKPRAPWAITLDGLAVGTLTGFVGVGGGFLIVPALVLLGGLAIHLAIGTSLCIITLQAFAGFFGHLTILDDLGLALHWPTLLVFSLIGACGSYIGRKMALRLPQHRLRRIFGGFLVVLGTLMLANNLGIV